MNIEALSGEGIQVRSSLPSEQVDRARKTISESPGVAVETADANKVQPEELLDQIKGLTENGVYSVRFETDETLDAMVVKVVDRDSDEVIRQIPPEELLHLMENLKELRGNLVDIVG